MLVINTITEMQLFRQKLNQVDCIGFVPTMGYLHQGHLSLVQSSIQKCKITIVSIFVNPTQFGANEDLSTYPRNLQRDLALLEDSKVDVVFFPTSEMMYPEGFKTWVEVPELSRILCGISRPTHFKGVTTVVLKLVNIIQPHLMFMGEKDFQQMVILETMLRDLNHQTKIVRCPIVREPDGLAMSSRNIYLSAQERHTALCLSKSIALAQEQFQAGNTNAETLTELLHGYIHSAGGKVDYVAFVDPVSLQPVTSLNSTTRILLAVYVGKTRLIDNSNLI